MQEAKKLDSASMIEAVRKRTRAHRRQAVARVRACHTMSVDAVTWQSPWRRIDKQAIRITDSVHTHGVRCMLRCTRSAALA